MNPSNFKERFYHERRLIQDRCDRRQKLGELEHKLDDFTASLENLKGRDLFNAIEEELLDTINYAAAEIIKIRIMRDKLNGEKRRCAGRDSGNTGSADGV